MKNKTALVCDDDQHIRDLVQAILEMNGYSVLQAENGVRACDMIEEERFRNELDLLILDVRMPEMTGHDVLDKLRAGGLNEGFSIIMLTAEATPDDIVLGYEKGAHYYITKPFTKQQLLYGINLLTDD